VAVERASNHQGGGIMSGESAKCGEFIKPVSDFTQRETYAVHSELIKLREATVKAQLDFAQAIMLEPGETSDSLQKEILLFLSSAHAHFKNLSDLLVKK
jgi:hypothetical protein